MTDLVCSRCLRLQPSDQFRPGHRQCRDCLRRARRAWRASHLEVARATARGWYASHRTLITRSAQIWQAANADRIRGARTAKDQVRRALQKGILVRADKCESCGRGDCAIEAAHPDYSRPLVVRWLCRPCHRNSDRSWPRSSVDVRPPSMIANRVKLGETNGAARLTADHVRAIRARFGDGGVSKKQLAREYGVSDTTIRNVVSGRLWSHVA